MLDIYPTLADLCGLTPPGNLEGQSLRPLLANPKARWTKPAITQQLRPHEGNQIMGCSLRTERWRYTEWDGAKAGAELYDHDKDPHEWRNLAGDPKLAKTIAALKSLLPKSAVESQPLPKRKRKA